ncbi:MAG: hypothetical protein WC421_10010 [Elusimicrobiales bacterium]
MTVSVLKGSAIVYRVFDVGSEINLARAAELLSGEGASGRLELVSDTRKAIVIRNAPLVASLGIEQITVAGRSFQTSVSAKIWDYGVISVAMALPLDGPLEWGELVKLAAALEESTEIEARAASCRGRVSAKIAPAIIQPNDWSTVEDYVTWLIEKYDGAQTPAELLLKADVPALILAEEKVELSANSRESAAEHALQYSSRDMAVIDWNSALLIEPSGSRETADVIEFCLTHLLEMRYYDALLERKLDVLYDSIGKRPGGGVFSNFYANLSEDAGRRYMEFSEFLGRVENSLKTVGDFYLATVFRAASREFRFSDWRRSVDRKMETLASISHLLGSEFNTRRAVLLELIIILLIALELIPFLKMLFQ